MRMPRGRFFLQVLGLLACISGATAQGRHGYKEALSKSQLFYLAQRSGALPDHDIPWRGNSALRDGSDVNRDLSGGWYDAGDFLKLNFPMAASATNLLWGLIEFPNGYSAIGSLADMRDLVKWPLDYFLKCWDADNQILYGQVGKSNIDHDYWGRPEEMTMSRPSYKLTTVHPGSDLAAQTAAALAAGYIAFKDTDSSYANKLLTAARSVYQFAESHHGLYQRAITDADDTYPSSGFQDELCWGAAWLYKATGETTYHQKAFKALEEAGTDTDEFSWDDKTIACEVLLHEAEPEGSVKKQQYAGYISSFLRKYRNGNGGITITPCGLSFRTEWGSLASVMNAALIALVAAQHGIEPQANRQWALSQVNYVLGDNKYGRSYVVGYGVNPPTKPHHASSSCRDPPAPCNWGDFDKTEPNGHILYGALVAGPDKQDNYADDRSDYVKNEVACDYNAGFQSTLAGIVSLENSGQLPQSHPVCPQRVADVTDAPQVAHVTTKRPASQNPATTTQRPASQNPATTQNPAADLDCTKFGSQRHKATASGYYPAPEMGGNMDMNDHRLQTLQDFLDGGASYVSVAMDDSAGIDYGTPLCIPELNHLYNRVILFKVVDSSSDLHGYSMINICASDSRTSEDSSLNGPVTLVFQ